MTDTQRTIQRVRERERDRQTDGFTQTIYKQYNNIYFIYTQAFRYIIVNIFA